MQKVRTLSPIPSHFLWEVGFQGFRDCSSHSWPLWPASTIPDHLPTCPGFRQPWAWAAFSWVQLAGGWMGGNSGRPEGEGSEDKRDLKPVFDTWGWKNPPPPHLESFWEPQNGRQWHQGERDWQGLGGKCIPLVPGLDSAEPRGPSPPCQQPLLSQALFTTPEVGSCPDYASPSAQSLP